MSRESDVPHSLVVQTGDKGVRVPLPPEDGRVAERNSECAGITLWGVFFRRAAR